MIYKNIKDKENNASDSADIARESSRKVEEFVPETGLAKSRMKQYLETAGNSSSSGEGSANSSTMNAAGGPAANGEIEDLPNKGLAKSLLAKWKSIENVKENNNHSPEGGASPRNSVNRTSPPHDGIDEQCLPQSGMAKQLLNKFQSIESNGAQSGKERKGPRPITPPPQEELERLKHMNEQDNVDSNGSGGAKPFVDEELALIGRGYAKNALAK